MGNIHPLCYCVENKSRPKLPPIKFLIHAYESSDEPRTRDDIVTGGGLFKNVSIDDHGFNRNVILFLNYCRWYASIHRD